MNNTTWPVEFLVNGELQTPAIIKPQLTDKQIQAITALITEWSDSNV